MVSGIRDSALFRALQVCLVCAVVASQGVQAFQASKVTSSLDGGWRVTSIERNGNHVTAPEAIKGMHLTFSGEIVVISGLYGKQEERCPFRQTDSVSPKQLDWTRPNGTKVLMLYDLNGRILRISFAFAGSPERPKVISGAPGSNAIVMTLERDATR